MASKWLNKRAQALNETMNKNADRTEFDPDFVTLEKQTDATKLVVEKLLAKMSSYLYPNPAARAKLGMNNALSKVTKGNAKRYPHPSQELGELMSRGAQDFEDENAFGSALKETGEALCAISETQHGYDAEVNQNFVDPLRMLLEKDIKEVMKHRKKLQGRRLDYDYKRRKQQQGKVSITDADIRIAEQKLEESKGLSESGMINLLESDVEQLGQVLAFVEATSSYHRTCLDILENLSATLGEKMSDMSSRPRREPKPVVQQAQYYDDDDDDEFGDSSGPCCKAIFDFEAENDGELTFHEGDMITLINRLDENWLEGEIDGRSGIFPSNYVEVIQDL